MFNKVYFNNLYVFFWENAYDTGELHVDHDNIIVDPLRFTTPLPKIM